MAQLTIMREIKEQIKKLETFVISISVLLVISVVTNNCCQSLHFNKMLLYMLVKSLYGLFQSHKKTLEGSTYFLEITTSPSFDDFFQQNQKLKGSIRRVKRIHK